MNSKGPHGERAVWFVDREPHVYRQQARAGYSTVSLGLEALWDPASLFGKQYQLFCLLDTVVTMELARASPQS